MRKRILLTLALATTALHCRSELPRAPEPALRAGAVQGRDPAAPTALIDRIAVGTSRVYPVDTAAYASGDQAQLPIGVFDSGVGGLTVLDALLTLDEVDNRTHERTPDGVPDFVDERFVYFGDQANMPYGRYAAEGREDFLRELIVGDAAFLLGNRYWPSPFAAEPRADKPRVKAIVIACNTATAYGIDDLRKALDAWKIPLVLVGVVEAGAEGAVASMKERGASAGAVGVMATAGTCKSGAYPRTIERFARAAGIPAPNVVQQGSVGLAGAIEGDPAFVRPNAAGGAPSSTYQGPAVGNANASIDPALVATYGFDPAGMSGDPTTSSWQLNSVENYVRYDVASLVENHRKQGVSAPIDTVVLGCTHFPFQKERIAAALERLRTLKDASGKAPYEGAIAPKVELVDPARLTARELHRSLVSKKRLRDPGRAPALDANAFFISTPNTALPDVKLTADGTLDAGYKYGRKAGNFERETVKRVPMRPTDLTPELRSMVQRSMPAVWSSLEGFQASKLAR